jgi:hypothetical protein
MPTYKALSVRQPYAWLIEFVPMKGWLGLFDVELPFEITWKAAHAEG